MGSRVLYCQVGSGLWHVKPGLFKACVVQRVGLGVWTNVDVEPSLFMGKGQSHADRLHVNLADLESESGFCGVPIVGSWSACLVGRCGLHYR